MADIKIQRGYADVGNSGGTTSPDTDFGSLSSTVVMNICNRRTNAGWANSASNMEIDDLSGGIHLSAVDTIDLDRESGAASQDARFFWEAWEYTGDAGGENEFIVRGRYKLTLTGESTTQSVSGISNIDDCIPFITGILCDSGSDDADAATAIAWMSGSGTLNVKRGSGSNNTVKVYVTVVEFTGSNWSVKHGRIESNADSGDITLVDAADGETSGGGDVGDWDNAIIFHQFKANALDGVDDAIADTSAIYYPKTGSTTQVTWAFDNGHVDSASAGQRNEHFVHVLVNPNITVTRFSDTQNTQGWMDVDISSAGISDLETTALEISRRSSGTGTAYGRGWVGAIYDSTTKVKLWAHRSGNTIQTRIQVIDLSNLTSIAITDMEDEQLDIGEQDNVITGFGFGSTQGSGKVELGENSDYTGTIVEQSIDSWSDTSIQFDLVQGSLTSGAYRYLFVTNDSGERSAGYRVWLGPHITDCEDELITLGETDIDITGAGFGSTQGNGKVELVENADYTGIKVEQTVNSWSNTSINFDSVAGSLKFGKVYLFVTEDNGNRSNAYEVYLGLYTYDKVIQNLDPDHWWQLDNSYDDDGDPGNCPMTQGVVGTQTFVADPICEKNTYAVKFDDVTDRREAPDNSEMNLSSKKERTFGGWIKLGDIQQSLSALYKEGAQVNNFAFLMGLGNVLMAQQADTGDDNVQAYSDFRLAVDRPYHIMFRMSYNEDPKEFRLFIDGVQQSVTDGNPLTSTDMDSHSGDIGWGDPDGNLEMGGTDVAFAGKTLCYYAQWASWSVALDKTNDIRKKLFERGALPDITISSDTQSNMQDALDAYKDTERPDSPLAIRVEQPSSGNDLELIADNITFDDRVSIQIQWYGSGTLTWVNINGSSVDSNKLSTPCGGTINIVNAPPVTITVRDASDNSVISGARVLITADSGGDLPYKESVSIVRTGSTATVTHTSHGLRSGVYVLIEGADQYEYNGVHEITVVDDNTYTYTVSGSPATPATGSITSTAVIIAGTTDANGEISVNHRYTSDQPISGKARKSSSSPLYKTGYISATITSNGYVGDIFLIRDE